MASCESRVLIVLITVLMTSLSSFSDSLGFSLLPVFTLLEFFNFVLEMDQQFLNFIVLAEVRYVILLKEVKQFIYLFIFILFSCFLGHSPDRLLSVFLLELITFFGPFFLLVCGIQHA